MILRDKDANSGWTSASDGTLEERRYYCQNWRSDVVCITDSSGDPQEWIRYSAYGVPFSIPKGDYNCDGVLDSNDTAALTSIIAGSPGHWPDFNQDGNADSGDTDALAAYITTNASAPGGRGKLSRGDATTSTSSLGNRIGYAGYQFDPALAGSVWHVRNRVLVSELGRWTKRDPIGYRDGMGLYEYSRGQSVVKQDPSGLVTCHNQTPGHCSQGLVSTIARSVPGRCRKQSTDPECETACAGTRLGIPWGVTPTLGGFPTGTCCICDDNIKDAFNNLIGNDPPPPGNDGALNDALKALMQCTEAHEHVHEHQIGGSTDCREAAAWKAELDCLAKAKAACRSPVCKDIIGFFIDGKSAQQEIYDRKCAATPNFPIVIR